jgi:hypothetical protein
MKKTNTNLFKIIIKKAGLRYSGSFSLVERRKNGSLLYQLFPINHRPKYPIFFNKLLERINNLKMKYNKHYSINVYQNLDLNRKLINKDLKNKGGIYL